MRNTDEDPCPISPDVRSPVRSSIINKRVTFSTDTKEVSRQTSRKLSFPPHIKQQGSRMPPGFARGPYPAARMHHQFPPPWMRHRMMPHAPGFMHPPMMVAPLPPPGDKWICDFCNVAAFDTYQEACVHEETCRHQWLPVDPKGARPSRHVPSDSWSCPCGYRIPSGDSDGKCQSFRVEEIGSKGRNL